MLSVLKLSPKMFDSYCKSIQTAIEGSQQMNNIRKFFHCF